MSGEQVLSLLAYQVLMSLLSVGGVITLASEQHRYMVLERGWLTDAQFQASITLAQVAPGPNVLFLALWGWHVGLNAATASGAAPWLVWAWAAAGMSNTMDAASDRTLRVAREARTTALTMFGHAGQGGNGLILDHAQPGPARAVGAGLGTEQGAVIHPWIGR